MQKKITSNEKIVVKVGTRSSKLAIRQAKIAIKAMQKINGKIKFEIVKIETKGDIRLESGIFEKSGFKGIFTKEIQHALLNKTIDIAVHSMKDLQIEIPKNNEIIAILKRDIPNDGFFSDKYKSLMCIPKNGKIGTSSIRRKMFINKLRPDLNVIPLRGNIETRLEKIKNQNLDGIILSYCGISRMKYLSKVKYYEKLNHKNFIPSPGQGAIGIEILSESSNEMLKKVLYKISCKKTYFCIKKERLLAKLAGAFCQTPFGCCIEKHRDFMIINVGFENQETKNSIFIMEKCRVSEIDYKIMEIASKIKCII